MPGAGSRLLRAGVFTGISDGLFSTVLTVFFYHSTFARLWQGVASTVFGPGAIGGGTKYILIGLVMHLCVAFTWSAVFLFLVSRLRPVQGLLASPGGTVKVAAVYGPSIWLVMSLVVIPVLLHRGPSITYRWWIQLIGHFPFVGLPIVGTIGREPAS